MGECQIELVYYRPGAFVGRRYLPFDMSVV